MASGVMLSVRGTSPSLSLHLPCGNNNFYPVFFQELETASTPVVEFQQVHFSWLNFFLPLFNVRNEMQGKGSDADKGGLKLTLYCFHIFSCLCVTGETWILMFDDEFY